MQVLEAVNAVLPALGEHLVTSVDVRHPTVQLIVQKLRENTALLCSEGKWFSKSIETLTPNPMGIIEINESKVLSLVPVQDLITDIRDGKLYNVIKNTEVWDAPITVILVHLLEFEELPFVAANYVLAKTKQDIFIQDLGVDNDAQYYAQEVSTAYYRVFSEHLRHVNYTTRRLPGYRAIVSALRG